MVKKAKWFFDGKKSIFQNIKVENFKNLENLWSKRDFFKFLQAMPQEIEALSRYTLDQRP